MNADLRADRDQALTVACPVTRCNAFPGELCVNLGTGAPLKHLPAHQARLDAAGVMHAPLPVADLRRAD